MPTTWGAPKAPPPSLCPTRGSAAPAEGHPARPQTPRSKPHVDLTVAPARRGPHEPVRGGVRAQDRPRPAPQPRALGLWSPRRLPDSGWLCFPWPGVHKSPSAQPRSLHQVPPAQGDAGPAQRVGKPLIATTEQKPEHVQWKEGGALPVLVSCASWHGAGPGRVGGCYDCLASVSNSFVDPGTVALQAPPSMGFSR